MKLKSAEYNCDLIVNQYHVKGCFSSRIYCAFTRYAINSQTKVQLNSQYIMLDVTCGFSVL